MEKFGISSALSLAMFMGVVVAEAGQEGPFAQLKELTGSAMLDTGDGFKPVQQGVELDKGNRLLLKSDSEGTIEYANNCQYHFKGQEIVNIGDTCRAGIWATSPTVAPAALAGLVVVVAVAASDDDDDRRSPVSP